MMNRLSTPTARIRNGMTYASNGRCAASLAKAAGCRTVSALFEMHAATARDCCLVAMAVAYLHDDKRRPHA